MHARSLRTKHMHALPGHQQLRVGRAAPVLAAFARQHANVNARFAHFKKSGKSRIEPVFAGLPIDRLVVGCRLPAKLIDSVDNLLDPHLGPMNPIVAVRVGISRSAHLMAQSLAAALDLARAVIRQSAAKIQGALPGELVFASCLAARQSARTRRVRSGPSPAQASGAISQTNGPYPEALAWCTAPLNVGAPCSRSPQRGALRGMLRRHHSGNGHEPLTTCSFIHARMLSVIASATYRSVSGSKLAGDSRRFTALAFPSICSTMAAAW